MGGSLPAFAEASAGKPCGPATVYRGRPPVAFDQPHASSDGGAVLLKAVDRQLGLLDRLAATLTYRRGPARMRHALRDLLLDRDPIDGVEYAPTRPIRRRPGVRRGA